MCQGQCRQKTYVSFNSLISISCYCVGISCCYKVLYPHSVWYTGSCAPGDNAGGLSGLWGPRAEPAGATGSTEVMIWSDALFKKKKTHYRSVPIKNVTVILCLSGFFYPVTSKGSSSHSIEISCKSKVNHSCIDHFFFMLFYWDIFPTEFLIELYFYKGIVG